MSVSEMYLLRILVTLSFSLNGPQADVPLVYLSHAMLMRSLVVQCLQI